MARRTRGKKQRNKKKDKTGWPVGKATDMKVRRESYAEIQIPAAVYGSIALLVNQQPKEVAWFGDVEVVDDNPFNLVVRVNEVYLYPQTVSSAAVHEPVQGDGYDEWYSDRIVRAQGRPVMQYYGHSHVNMAVKPSGTDIDMRDQNAELNVFSIHNKKGDMHWEIWTKDYIYSDEEIEVVVIASMLDETELIKESKPVAANVSYGYHGSWQQSDLKGTKPEYGYHGSWQQSDLKGTKPEYGLPGFVNEDPYGIEEYEDCDLLTEDGQSILAMSDEAYIDYLCKKNGIHAAI